MHEVCLHCDEPLTAPCEWRSCSGAGGPTLRGLHRVCAARLAVGGLNHLQGRCTCCGGTEPPDPPDLTRHEAAIAAVSWWQAHAVAR
jgi:hypothetical protein